MELVTGQLVISRKGRDVTRAYAVLQPGEQRVLVCDGRKWTLQQPKAKNPRHLQPTATILPVGEMQTDQTIQQAILDFDQKRFQKQQGG